jgi:hypothetical protein
MEGPRERERRGMRTGRDIIWKGREIIGTVVRKGVDFHAAESRVRSEMMNFRG